MKKLKTNPVDIDPQEIIDDIDKIFDMIKSIENTDFKTGFGGLAPQFDKDKIYSLSVKNQLKLFGFVGKNVIKSPGYLNQSILDSLGSFASRYV